LVSELVLELGLDVIERAQQRCGCVLDHPALACLLEFGALRHGDPSHDRLAWIRDEHRPIAARCPDHERCTHLAPLGDPFDRR
jgi:hypothetical protein